MKVFSIAWVLFVAALLSITMGSPITMSSPLLAQQPAASKTSATKTSPSKTSAGKTASSKAPLTAEQEKKMKSLLRETLKSFAAAELTAEQQQKADELFSKAIKSFVVKRSEASITDEMEKKLVDAMKSANGQTVKEQATAAYTTAGFSEVQIKVFESTRKSLDRAKREFAKTLTDAQTSSLPKTLQASLRTSRS